MPHATRTPDDPHPTTCRCHGTGCRHVVICDHETGESYELVTDDPCEDYGVAEREQLRDYEDERGVE